MSIHALPTNQIRAIRRTGSSRCSSAWITGSQNAAGSGRPASHCADIHRRESPPNMAATASAGRSAAGSRSRPGLRRPGHRAPNCHRARDALRPDPGFESGDIGRAAPVAQGGDGGNPNAHHLLSSASSTSARGAASGACSPRALMRAQVTPSRSAPGRALAARRRSRQGRQRTAVLSIAPPTTSYHHFCCFAVQTCSSPQSRQVNMRSR